MEYEELENQAYIAFRKKYHLQNPAPQKPVALSISNVGLQFFLYLATSLASLGLAAMRTSDAFYQVASKSTGSWLFSPSEALLAVLAVEGGMIVYSSAKAIREGSDKVKVSGFMASTGVAIMLLISTLAGTNQSIAIIDNIPPSIVNITLYSLAIALGVGVSFIAYIGGEVIGQQVVIVSKTYEKKLAEYAVAFTAYMEHLNASWKVSPERKHARNGEVYSSVDTEPNKRPFGGREPVQTRKIFSYMDDTWTQDNRIASFHEVVAETGAPKSSASEIRNQWIAKYPERLTAMIETSVPFKEKISETNTSN